MSTSKILANVTIETSRFPYPETVDKRTEAIKDAGATLFAHIDQSAAAAGAGLSLRPTTRLIYGNPRAGTLLMDAFPLTAMDLPLKFLVWEENGIVSVGYVPVKSILSRYDATGEIQLVEVLERAVAALLARVT